MRLRAIDGPVASCESSDARRCEPPSLIVEMLTSWRAHLLSHRTQGNDASRIHGQSDGMDPISFGGSNQRNGRSKRQNSSSEVRQSADRLTDADAGDSKDSHREYPLTVPRSGLCLLSKAGSRRHPA
jgi:hypothetical protein